jgi:hypothetical protein
VRTGGRSFAERDDRNETLFCRLVVDQVLSGVFRPTVLVGASGQPVPRAEIERRVLAAMWRPEYLSYRVATDEEEPEPLTTPTARERTPGSARPS